MTEHILLVDVYGAMVGAFIACFGVYLRLIHPNRCNYKQKTLAYLWITSGLGLTSLNAHIFELIPSTAVIFQIVGYTFIFLVSLAAAALSLDHFDRSAGLPGLDGRFH